MERQDSRRIYGSRGGSRRGIVSRLRSLFTLERVARMGADLAMLWASLLVSLLLWPYSHTTDPAVELPLRPWDFAPAFVALGVLGLLTFYLSGFYTRGRAYRSRYKVLIVSQAVSLAYLELSGLCLFLPHVVSAPRAAILLSWAISLGLLVGARLWAAVWARVVLSERSRQAVQATPPSKHVLLIGGAGYIGSALLPKLLDKGYRVRLMDLFIYGEDSIAKVREHPSLEIVRADFRQVDKVVWAMRDVDAVIHLGAIVGDPACELDEACTIEVNLTATRLIAEVAKGHGVGRFIFASTCSVYGASDELLDERSALNPLSLYARSKMASEQVLLRMATEYFHPVILRFGTIFGMSGRTRFDLVANLLTAKAVVEGKITVYGSDQWRPFLHVDDAARSLLAVLEAPLDQVRCEVFNVGCNSQNYTLGQLGAAINDLVPTAELVSSPSDPKDRRNYRVDFCKIGERLGFETRWSLEDGIRQVIHVLRSGQVKDYRDAQYSNVKFLSEEFGLESLKTRNGWESDILGTHAVAEVEARKDTEAPLGLD